MTPHSTAVVFLHFGQRLQQDFRRQVFQILRPRVEFRWMSRFVVTPTLEAPRIVPTTDTPQSKCFGLALIPNTKWKTVAARRNRADIANTGRLLAFETVQATIPIQRSEPEAAAGCAALEEAVAGARSCQISALSLQWLSVKAALADPSRNMRFPRWAKTFTLRREAFRRTYACQRHVSNSLPGKF